MSKKLPKILTISFLLIFALQLAILIFLFSIPEPSLAATAELDLQVDIPGSSFEKLQPYGSTKAIGEYVKAIYTYAIGIVGILAAVVLMFGGVLWITAGGNNERISSAKSWIAASLSGLVLALCSYMILYTINPQLVKFKITGIDEVKKGLATGCCAKGDIYLGIITEKQCKTKNGAWGGEGSAWYEKEKKCIIEIISKDTSDCDTNSGRTDGDLCYVNKNSSSPGYCINGTCSACKSPGQTIDGPYKYACCNSEYITEGADINFNPVYKCAYVFGCCLYDQSNDGSEWDECNQKAEADCKKISPSQWNEGKNCIDRGTWFNENWKCE